ncbi:S9 family peptidase [Emcibacter sp. SYSU 3D8]|uniref:alpha/beta hydrolase family protein n=1 Tax=Emcibacter sp. SYSU 3D8 TaxID=3133969 RepID=UPI0031FE9B12
MTRKRGLIYWLGPLLGAAAVTFVACSRDDPYVETPASHPALAQIHLPPILTRQELFGERREPFAWRLSDDGALLAWLEPGQAHRTRLLIETLATRQRRTIELPMKPQDISWGPGATTLFLDVDTMGNEHFRTYAVRLEDPNPLPLPLSPESVTTEVEQYWGADLVVSDNRRDRDLMDVYRRNLRDGKETRIARNPGDVIDWHALRDAGLFARTRRVPSGGVEIDVLRGGAWVKKADVAVEETFQFIGNRIIGGGVLALSNRGRDKVALVRFSLADGSEKLLYAEPDADVEWVWRTGPENRPVVAEAYPARRAAHYFDAVLGSALHDLAGDDPRTVASIEDLDSLGRRVVVNVASDEGRTEIWLVDRQSGERRLLHKDERGRRAENFARTEPFQFTARDGLEIHGYVTVPRGGEGRRLPAIVWVHGGPFARSYWGFDPMVQFLANRGYVVIDVNYRGSTGYGKKFMAAARGEFSRKMNTDLVDALDWAIARGMVDKDHVAIGGASYGGWAALVGLAEAPDRFVAGISINGPSDLTSLVAWLSPTVSIWTVFAGNPDRPGAVADMDSRSPLQNAEKIVDPVLIIHSTEDDRVPINHGERMAQRLHALGRPVETMWVPGEGHAMATPERFEAVADRMEHFLAQHLGGRVSRQ